VHLIYYSAGGGGFQVLSMWLSLVVVIGGIYGFIRLFIAVIDFVAHELLRIPRRSSAKDYLGKRRSEGG
jgi:hypothetical protein